MEADFRAEHIVAAYAAGEDVRAISARFGTAPAEVERLVAQSTQPPAEARAMRFNPPPGWPAPPEGWLPPEGWRPDESWPTPPPGWRFFVEQSAGSPQAPVPWVPGEVIADRTVQSEPGVLWAAKGQPLTGFGAGRYKLTHTMLFFEKGTLSTRAQQIPIAQVMDVDMRQSVTQKARGVGNVLVHVQRGQGVELVVLEDIPDPRAAVTVINNTARAARLAEQQRQNTHHYSGVPPMAAQAVAEVPTPPSDPIEQLRRLGEVRDAGIVTEEEFAAKKAEILSRL